MTLKDSSRSCLLVTITLLLGLIVIILGCWMTITMAQMNAVISQLQMQRDSCFDKYNNQFYGKGSSRYCHQATSSNMNDQSIDELANEIANILLSHKDINEKFIDINTNTNDVDDTKRKEKGMVDVSQANSDDNDNNSMITHDDSDSKKWTFEELYGPPEDDNYYPIHTKAWQNEEWRNRYLKERKFWRDWNKNSIEGEKQSEQLRKDFNTVREEWQEYLNSRKKND